MRLDGSSLQERGLVLLLGAAVLLSGLFLLPDQASGPTIPSLELIRLDNVDILIPHWTEAEPVHLNRATLEDLMSLPGIGPVLAQRIVDDRAENGSYTSLEELKRVSGIGPQTIEKLREDVIVADP